MIKQEFTYSARARAGFDTRTDKKKEYAEKKNF